MKTIKVYPKEPTYIDRRRVLYFVCEVNDTDNNDRIERLKSQAENNKKSVIRKSSAGTIKYFDSVGEAANATGISNSSVSKCINGRQSSAGGYEFKKGE